MQAEPAADRSIRDSVGFAPVDYATTELKDRMGEDLRGEDSRPPRNGAEEMEDKGIAGEEEAGGPCFTCFTCFTCFSSTEVQMLTPAERVGDAVSAPKSRCVLS